MKVKYTGSSDVREVGTSDFSKADLDHPSVTWSAENDFTAEVGKEAAEWLMEKDKDFKKA